MKTEVEVLEQIHKSVKSTHWIKKLYAGFKPDDPNETKECYCLAGHINVASGLSAAQLAGTQLTKSPEEQGSYGGVFADNNPQRRLANQVGRLMFAAIKEYDPKTRMDSIEGWNDRRRTTREDVLAVVKIALKAAKKDAKKVAA